MTEKIAERLKVVDCDTHVIEPYDLWTSRLPQKWVDRVPRVARYSGDAVLTGPTLKRPGDDVWIMGDQTAEDPACMPVGVVMMAGYHGALPDHPPTQSDADPSCYDPTARLKKMDEYGVHAQLLYPNVGGFGFGRFLSLGDSELMLACVQAYNDFLVDYASAAPGRFIPLMATPFWDIGETVKEVERCYAAGHKGIVFTAAPETYGQPFFGDAHWDPLWERAQALGLPINFHIGNGNFAGSAPRMNPANGIQINYARSTASAFIGNSAGIMEAIGSGVLHRFSRLNIVSVESGIGWIPFMLEAMEWQWDNSGVHEEHPEYNLTPTEYFKRQVYGCFWFEEGSAKAALDLLGPDNFLFETDFPHPTSIAPGPNSRSLNPIDHIETYLGQLPEETLRKVLHDNAARIYHLD